MTKLTPAIFFGHGNPMNAIGQNVYTDGWSHLGQTMLRPKTILSISLLSQQVVRLCTQYAGSCSNVRNARHAWFVSTPSTHIHQRVDDKEVKPWECVSLPPSWRPPCSA